MLISNFRIEVEKCIQAVLELFFDLFLTALEHMHGDTCFPAILELQNRIFDLGNFFRGQQSETVD